MDSAKLDKILGEIDKAVGKAEDETPQEREARRQMIERDMRQRQIRKSANPAA